MNRLYALPAVLAAAVVAGLFWWWMGRPVVIADAPSLRMHCLSYTPYDGGKAPIDPGYDVTPEIIAADLKALSAITDCIRTYSSRGPQGAVVKIAGELGFKVYLGIWVNANPKDSADEVDRAIEIAKENPQAVKALVVGNEVMLRREMTPEKLASYIREVKTRSGMPVTYADIYEFYRRNPLLAEVVDFMMIHILPYWDDPEPVTIDLVQPHISNIVKTLRDAFPGKAMMIGEIGWPSEGRARGGARPSLVNEARFVREFMGQAASLGMDYNIIEGVDQGWKRRPEGTVGGYWGVFDGERRQKFPLTGPVSEWPRWQENIGATLAIALLLIGWGLMPGRRITPAGWIGLGALGSLLGATLILHGHQTVVSSVYWVGWAKGGLFAFFTLAALRMLLLPRIDSSLTLPGVPARLEEVLAWLRRPSRERATPEIMLGLLAWAILVSAAIMAVVMSVDGRHRDFPVAGLWLPAVAFALHWLRTGPARWIGGRLEEGWLALLTAAFAPFAWDGFGDPEAYIWIVLAILLALPWLGAGLSALRSSTGAVKPSRAN